MIGHLVRVSGPTAIAGGLDGVAINELVLVGEERLLGEVVRVDHDRATLQIYEETTGLALGEPAETLGGPLAVELGPGLLGGIFDGLQRPLPALAELSGDFIARGMRMPGLDRARRWRFTPTVSVGDVIAGGQLIGYARAVDTLGVDPGGGHGDDRAEKVVAPPHAQGRVVAILEGADERGLCITDPVLQLDDGSTLGLLHRWPVRGARPLRRRLPPDQPFLTGQRVLDGFFPVAAGGVAVVPGGFGSGKTILEQALARHAAADIIVYVGCGERGNEMAELLDEFRHLRDPRSGRALLERTVLVVNTSNMPVAAREASMYTGLTIAEYFRDLGHSVALMIDSTSRWAEALREISSRLEEMPGEEGYPTYLSTRLTQFYERAGRGELLGGGEGAVTIVGAVSPPGGDFSEPVTQGSLRAADALWALSSELAHRRHYPAVDWSLSFTLDADRLAPWFERAAGEGWGALRIEAMRLLGKERELAEIAQLVGADALQDGERIVLESARLLREGFLRQNAFDPVDATTPPARMRWMLGLLLHFHRRASDAIAAGVALRDIMAAGIGDRLLFLGQVAETDREAFDHAAREAIDGALDRLRAAT